MIVLTITVGLLCVLLYYVGNFLQVRWRHTQLLKHVPGPPQNLIFGNILEFMGPHENILPILQRWCKEYGPRVAYRMGLHWGVMITCAKDAEKVLSSQNEIDKSHDYERLIPWLGTGLLTSKGKKWFQRRKMLTPAFHFKILEQFTDVFNEQSVELVRILQEKYQNTGQDFDIAPFITRCTLDIICESAMGKKINAQRETDTVYLKATHRISQLIEYRSLNPFYHYNFIWYLTPSGREENRCLEILHGFTDKVIRERKADFLKSGRERSTENDVDSFTTKRKLAFLDLLLEAQRNDENQLRDEDIREETDTFMFEGHDTTAASINYVIYLLGCYPDIQEKVHEELDVVFGEDKSRPVTMEDLTKLKYLEACIKEALRLYPSVPYFLRALNSDFVLDDKVTVPAGVVHFIFPYQLHRDPQVFPDPEKYQPERFLAENVIGRHPFAYVPFSGGPRNCIGQKFAMMEEKTLISTLFRHFKVVSSGKQEDLVVLPELILRPRDGIRIKIFKR